MPIKLTANHLQKFRPNGKNEKTGKDKYAPLTDSDVRGLRLTPTGEKTGKWNIRYRSPVTKKDRDYGLGAYPRVSLAAARQKAREVRAIIDAGKDPLMERDAEQERARQEAIRAEGIPTFGHAAETYHTRQQKLGVWKQTKNVAAWLASIRNHLGPLLERRVDTLTARDFQTALEPVWFTKDKIASDVMQRATEVMDWCEASEYITGNPCPRARKMLGKVKHVTKHQPSMSYKLVPAFVAEHFGKPIDVTDLDRAAAFVQMHVASRPGEARMMRWSELDLDAGVWLLPVERMKGKRVHDVPLPTDVVKLLRRMEAAKLHEDFVFPNTLGTNPISDVRLQTFLREAKAPSDTSGRTAVPHGWRATFKAWGIAELHDDRILERQLAHKPKGQTNQAYDRDSQLDQRRIVVEKWANYLHGRATLNVVPFTAPAAVITEPALTEVAA